MPGYTTWKHIYKQELIQMEDEGYDISDIPVMSPDGDSVLPFPGWEAENEGEDSEKAWEAAYNRLMELEKQPLRADYPYVEPNDFEEILTAAAPAPELAPLSEEAYKKRIYGAFFGRVAAVVLGKPVECGLNADAIRSYLEGANAWPLTDYIPATSPGSDIKSREDCIYSTKGNIHFAQCDDDINYTLLALHLAETKGLDFTAADVGRNWLDNVPYHWFWCASRQAYYHMVCEVPVEQIPTLLNPWRECIDGQIRCDLWGYIAPGNLRKAALGAYKDCSFSLVKNGTYGGMFVAGCIAAALSANPTVDTILDGGLAVIPEKSRLAEMVRIVRGWYRETPDYDTVCRKISERWGHMQFAATINNMAIVVLAILEGNMDYSRTITAAVCGGIDTDCNAGTAGSIIGAAVGIDNIDRRWYIPLEDTLKTTVACYGQVKISDIAEKIIAVEKKLREA